MGNKTHPKANRLGNILGWSSNWFTSDKKQFAEYLHEDYQIRSLLEREFPKIIGRIHIERTSDLILVSIHTSKPGIIIGPNGTQINRVNTKFKKQLKKKININIIEIKVPELNAVLVAQNIGMQIEERKSYKRAVHRAIDDALHAGAKGIKISIKGRINGVEIARKVDFMKGSVPLQSLRADIDYADYSAKTIAGLVGIKVWIFTREVYGKRDLSLDVNSVANTRKKRR